MSYGKYTKLEKPVMVTTSYKGSDDEEELETVPIINNNNNVNVVSVSNSYDDIEIDKKKF